MNEFEIKNDILRFIYDDEENENLLPRFKLLLDENQILYYFKNPDCIVINYKKLKDILEKINSKRIQRIRNFYIAINNYYNV